MFGLKKSTVARKRYSIFVATVVCVRWKRRRELEAHVVLSVMDEITNLRQVRKLFLHYYGSSRSWTAWTWVKSEWLLARKNGRLDFLRDCKSQQLLPRFIRDSIRSRNLFGRVDRRLAAAEHTFGMQVLCMVIRKEYRERIGLRKTAVKNRQSMFSYTKEEYLFAKKAKLALVTSETMETKKRHARKLASLNIDNRPATRTFKRDRVTCIDTSITEAERTLLARGPTFVPTS